MKIKMLNDRYDGELLIWYKDDIYDVNKSTINNFYTLRNIKGQDYGVEKSLIDIEYEALDE